MRIRLKFRLDDQVVYGCFSSVQRIGSTNSSAVLYTPQELTEDEKSQARENIGVQDPNLLVVTVDGSYKASHAAHEIAAFVENGGSAVLVWFSNVFNPKIITAAKCQFGTMFNSAKGATEWILDVDASGTATFSAIECGALKNPNAITFTGAVSAIYDGSKPVEVEIPTPKSVDIPEALPNPNAITFTGAVEATYDGSQPVEVEIPEGGGGNSVYFSEEEPTDAKTGDFWYDESEGESEEANADYIPVPQSANIGQTIVVKAVDENGKPTEWEAVDLPSGGSSGGKTFFLRNEDAYFGSSTNGIMIFVNPELFAEIEREVNGESVCSVRVIYEEDDGSKITESRKYAAIVSLPNGLTFADIYCSSTESIAVKTSEDADAVIAMISE